jgi:hypothetical protein
MTDTSPAATEVALQRLLTTYIFTGLLFLVLPGTFLGVWNLISISGRHSLAGLSPSWLQAHGHAQIFGWLGTFIIGIGYYSLVKMVGSCPLPSRAVGQVGLCGPPALRCAGWPTSASGTGASCCRYRRRFNSQAS